MMDMPSRYKPAAETYNPEAFGITAIVTVYRRVYFFKRMVWALLNQVSMN
jgi:hypothetical protein